ncbi:MAG: hypothetical protein GY797_36125 [Deltaproteobacteria bacterium]|nr:hypothetical protein [Deltaproteobacteria bacterium]
MKQTKSKGLTPPKTADDILNMYYLEARSHLLETAAILDRIERADNGQTALEDKRVKTLFKICKMLPQAKSNRAEQLLQMLSVS